MRISDWSSDVCSSDLGKWSNDRWWKIKPKQHQGRMLGNTGGSVRNDPYIAGLDLPGFASLSLPGVLRIAYPQFIHYAFYVPIDSGHTKYVGVMRSEEHTSELQSLMSNSYAVFCLKKKIQ